MVTLLRAALAITAAITCCVAGWAGLLALGQRERPRASGPPDLRPPNVTPPAPPDPLPAVRDFAEASSARTRELGAATFVVHGPLPDAELALTVYSAWSTAPQASRVLEAGAAGATVTFAGLRHGEYWALLAPADATTPTSYQARLGFVVPAPAAFALDARTFTLRVRVVDAAGAPVARALVHLTRPDDPAWIAPLPAVDGFLAPLTDAQGELVLGPLGAGAYRVAVAGDPAPPVAVTVPDLGEVRITTTTPR